MIRLFLKITNYFIPLIFQDGFWVVHILFGNMVKLHFLSQFPLDNLLRLVLSRLILSLRQFTAFDYDMIDRFVTIITKSTFAILLYLLYSCFDIVLMASFCAVIRRDSFSLLMFPFLIHVQVFLCEISLVCHLKCPYS